MGILSEDDLTPIPGNLVTITDRQLKNLFDELINAGRDMEQRDRLGNHYMPKEEYYQIVRARFFSEPPTKD